MSRNQISYSQNLRFVEQINNYNNYIYFLTAEYLGSSILDVGCGIGNISQFYPRDKKLTGMDTTKEYIDIFMEKCPQADFVIMDISNIKSSLLFEKDQIDTVTCFNVLEHIKDDGLALKNIRKILSPKGTLILMVPAHEFLYGTIDKTNLHYRRYKKKALAALLESSGFTVRKTFYFNSLGIFWWFLEGKIFKKNNHIAKSGIFINVSVPFVKLLDKIFLYKFGLSIVAVADVIES